MKSDRPLFVGPTTKKNRAENFNLTPFWGFSWKSCFFSRDGARRFLGPGPVSGLEARRAGRAGSAEKNHVPEAILGYNFFSKKKKRAARPFSGVVIFFRENTEAIRGWQFSKENMQFRGKSQKKKKKKK